MARGGSGRFGASPSGRFNEPQGSDRHSRTSSQRRPRRTSETGRLEPRRRTLGGEFDLQSSGRAIELIEEVSLHGSITISDGLVDVCFMFTRGGLQISVETGES